MLSNEYVKMKLIVIVAAFYFAFIVPLDAGKKEQGGQKAKGNANTETDRTPSFDSNDVQGVPLPDFNEGYETGARRELRGFRRAARRRGGGGGSLAVANRPPSTLATIAIVLLVLLHLLPAVGRSVASIGSTNHNLDHILSDHSVNGMKQIAAFVNNVAKFENGEGQISSKAIEDVLSESELPERVKTSILNGAQASCGEACFRGLMMTLASAGKEKDRDEIFRAIDKDKSNMISKAEMNSFIKAVCDKMGREITKEAKQMIKSGIEEIMEENNGELTKKEFMALIGGSDLAKAEN